MTLVSKQIEKASKALRHYYVHGVSGGAGEPVSRLTEGHEMETPVEPESVLAPRLELWSTTERRQEEEEGEALHQTKTTST